LPGPASCAAYSKLSGDPEPAALIDRHRHGLTIYGLRWTHQLHGEASGTFIFLRAQPAKEKGRAGFVIESANDLFFFYTLFSWAKAMFGRSLKQEEECEGESWDEDGIVVVTEAVLEAATSIESRPDSRINRAYDKYLQV